MIPTFEERMSGVLTETNDILMTLVFCLLYILGFIHEGPVELHHVIAFTTQHFDIATWRPRPSEVELFSSAKTNVNELRCLFEFICIRFKTLNYVYNWRPKAPSIFAIFDFFGFTLNSLLIQTFHAGVSRHSAWNRRLYQQATLWAIEVHCFEQSKFLLQIYMEVTAHFPKKHYVMLLPLSWIKECGQKFIIYCLLKNPMFIIYSGHKLLKTEGLTSSIYVRLKILKALKRRFVEPRSSFLTKRF
jgi:hypothetical protein